MNKSIQKLKNLVFYSVIIMIFASIYYYVMTRNIPTPFKDSITVVQKELRKQTASARKRQYANGMLLGCFVAYLLYTYDV